jgi:hypothetical protein
MSQQYFFFHHRLFNFNLTFQSHFVFNSSNINIEVLFPLFGMHQIWYEYIIKLYILLFVFFFSSGVIRDNNFSSIQQNSGDRYFIRKKNVDVKIIANLFYFCYLIRTKWANRIYAHVSNRKIILSISETINFT